MVSYQCADMEAPFAVEYINAAPLFLAFVPIAGDKQLFVNVISRRRRPLRLGTL